MSSKDKAKELVLKFRVAGFTDFKAKRGAKICVEEILWFIEDADPQALSYELIGYRDFYREVLVEIDEL